MVWEIGIFEVWFRSHPAFLFTPNYIFQQLKSFVSKCAHALTCEAFSKCRNRKRI